LDSSSESDSKAWRGGNWDLIESIDGVASVAMIAGQEYQ